MFRKLVLVIILLLAMPAWAQTGPTPDERMQIASQREHLLLLERDYLLDRERAMVSPVWVGNGIGDVRILPADLVVEMARSFSALMWLRSRLEPDSSVIPPLILTLTYAVMNSNASNPQTLVRHLQSTSEKLRQLVLAAYDRELQKARDDFFAAMAERDAVEAEPVSGWIGSWSVTSTHLKGHDRLVGREFDSLMTIRARGGGCVATFGDSTTESCLIRGDHLVITGKHPSGGPLTWEFDREGDSVTGTFRGTVDGFAGAYGTYTGKRR